jgi:hypothetical protein
MTTKSCASVRSAAAQPVSTANRTPLARATRHQGAEDGGALDVFVPAAIRANLAAREVDSDGVLRSLKEPLLVTRVRADSVVLHHTRARPARADVRTST